MNSTTANFPGLPGKQNVKKNCKYLAKGDCKDGDACNFSHEVKKSNGTGKAPKTASNKVVNAPKETNPVLIALMEEVRIAEERVRVDKATNVLNARLKAASSYEQQQQVAVVAQQKGREYSIVFDDEAVYKAFVKDASVALLNVCSQSVSDETKRDLAGMGEYLAKYGYNGTVKGVLKVLGVTQGIQFAVFKANPREFRNHYNSIDPKTQKHYSPREAAPFFKIDQSSVPLVSDNG